MRNMKYICPQFIISYYLTKKRSSYLSFNIYIECGTPICNIGKGNREANVLQEWELIMGLNVQSHISKHSRIWIVLQDLNDNVNLMDGVVFRTMNSRPI